MDYTKEIPVSFLQLRGNKIIIGVSRVNAKLIRDGSVSTDSAIYRVRLSNGQQGDLFVKKVIKVWPRSFQRGWYVEFVGELDFTSWG